MRDVEDRKALTSQIRAEMSCQNEQWEGTRRAMTRLGSSPVPVPCAILSRLDELAEPSVPSVPNCSVRA